MKKAINTALTLGATLVVALAIFAFMLSPSADCETDPERPSSNTLEKQKGAHVLGHLDSSNYHLIKQNNVEWVTMIGWGYQDDIDSPFLTHHNGDSAYIAQSDSGYISRIQLAHSLGFKIFLKPHVWIQNPAPGKWRSDIFPSSTMDWLTWKISYRDFILRYARVAEKAEAEMFCLGMEFSRLAVEKPEFWRELIAEVRAIYSGKLTYAANWYEEYEDITFWDDLDYIGIQAYFPLVKNEYPSVEQVSSGWQKYLEPMKSLSRKFDRKVLFTELGYKSTADAAVTPWSWPENLPDDHPTSDETQANCYEAFFNTVWDEQWLAGVHLWQMRCEFGKNRRLPNRNFVPQDKPAEAIIAREFGEH